MDAPALARDGHQRPAQVRLEYVVDPIATGRLQAINLRRQRESLRVQFTIMPGENFEHMEYVPTEVVRLTSAELGLTDQLMEVERVEYREDWSVNLTLREVLDGTYEDTLVLPPLLPRVIKLPDEDAAPSVDGLSSDEIAETGRDGKSLIQLHISWTAVAVRETEVEVREKPAAGATDEPAWQSGVSVGNRFRYPNVADGKTYQIRARHWNRHDVAGEWSATIEHTVEGDLEPPAAPTNLQVFSAPEGIRATWENPKDDDWWAACIYIGTTNTFDENTLAATLAADVYEAGGWTAGTTYYVWVRAKDTSGNLGPTTEPVAVTPTALADEGATIFTGAGPPDDATSTQGSKDGDLYIDAWTKTQIDLTGTAGATIHTYSGEIDADEDHLYPPDTITDPAVGDIAIHADSGHWYERTATDWAYRGDLTGPPGPKGASVLHWPHDTDPLSTFGVAGDVAEGATPTASGENVGDVYVATDGRWWEWDGSAWQFRSSLAGKDGPGIELIFRRTTEDTAPDTPVLDAAKVQLPDQTPDGWTDDPQGVDEDNPFEWVSERRRNSGEVWSDFSAPGKWAVYIPGEPGEQGKASRGKRDNRVSRARPGNRGRREGKGRRDQMVPRAIRVPRALPAPTGGKDRAERVAIRVPRVPSAPRGGKGLRERWAPRVIPEPRGSRDSRGRRAASAIRGRWGCPDRRACKGRPANPARTASRSMSTTPTRRRRPPRRSLRRWSSCRTVTGPRRAAITGTRTRPASLRIRGRRPA